MKNLDRISQVLNGVLMWIGGLFLIGMVALTCGNIVFRLLWLPIRGAFELMGYFGAVVAAFALGYTQIKKGHIAVDVLINSFSDRTRRVINALNSAACLLFLSVCAWQISVKATTLWQTGEVTETLRIIYYPFTYGVALGCALLALVFLTDLLKALFPHKEDEE